MNTNNWLDQVKEDERSVVVKTVEGRRVRGEIAWYDSYNISIENRDGEEVFFKQNLISIKAVNTGGK